MMTNKTIMPKKGESMTTREWLNRGFKLAIEIRELDIAYSTALSEADYISPSFADRVQTGQNNSVEGKNIKAIGLNDKLLALIESKRKIIAEIAGAIERIDDNKIRAVMYARYVNCKTIELIAVEQSKSFRQICRILKQGEKVIKEI